MMIRINTCFAAVSLGAKNGGSCMNVNYIYIGETKDAVEDAVEYFRTLEKESQAFRKTWIYRGQKCDNDLQGLHKLRAYPNYP